MLYIKLFIEREKNIGQSAPECPFNRKYSVPVMRVCVYVDWFAAPSAESQISVGRDGTFDIDL